MKKHQNGFTLVELCVVVAIIAILSAVAIPNFKRYKFMKDCNQDKDPGTICFYNNKGQKFCGEDYSRRQYCQKLSKEHMSVEYSSDLVCTTCKMPLKESDE